MSTRENSTKRRLCVTALACLAVAMLGANAAAEEKFQKLTAGQIRAKLTGMELTDNVHWRDLYQRNGTVMSTSMGRKRTGKWRVEEDQLCIEFEKEPIPRCYDVWLSGKQVELRREGLLPLQGTLEPSSGRN
jgi:hypothetical protein